MNHYFTIAYDTKYFDFIKVVKDLFNGVDLHFLHTQTTEEYKEQFEVGKDSSTVFHKQFYDKFRSGWPEMQDLYDRFVKDIINMIFEGQDDVLYQSFPTFRVHLPKNVAVGAFHNDAEFGHPAGEINCIIPLTNSDGTASVWVESESGKKDFQPIPLNEGQLIIFNGNTLTHGNKMNLTDQTRVSMDFRLLQALKYDESNLSESITQKTKFKEGAYYKRVPRIILL